MLPKKTLPLFFLLLSFGSYAQGEDTLKIFTYSHVSGVSGTGESLYDVDDVKIHGNIKGTEFDRVKCGRLEGRESSVVSNAYALIQSESDSVGTVRLSSQTYTEGGHYRTCGVCIKNGWCIDISGVDTTAKAKSTAKADFQFKIDENQAGADQIVTISSPNLSVLANPAFKYEVSGGEKFVIDEGNDEPIKLLIVPGAEHHGMINVTVFLETQSENEGGCCDDGTNVEALITVGMQEAALMQSAFVRFEPRLVQGDPEDGFVSVGLIELKEKRKTGGWIPHCTGSLIAEKIVLTAAHCIKKYDEEKHRLRFMLAPEHGHVDAKYREISQLIVPMEKDGMGFEYKANGNEHIDDIGIIVLESGFQGVEYMKLHAGIPDITNFEADGRELTFIGYGAISRAGTNRGLGRKHKLKLPIKDVTMRRFKNQLVDVKNTCRGDSGGPALIEMPDGNFVIAGVVSKGDTLCRISGINTRVESYEQWVKSKI